MLILTSDISIGEVKDIKASKVTWKSEVGSFIDSCTIELPRISYLKNTQLQQTVDLNQEQESSKRMGYAFKEGDKVCISLGYNKVNQKRFEGFVKRVNMGVPVKIECEGYGYQLYDKIFNKTYDSVTVRKLLEELTIGTCIIVSKEIPDIPLKNVRFKNVTGIKVLEWLKDECKLAVYFNMNEIFVGTLYGKTENRIKARIGWNTVKDDEFRQKAVDKTTKIVITEKNDKGEVNKTKSDQRESSGEKSLKVKAGIPAQFLKQIANRLQTKENYKGYEGNITLFLEPYAVKGMVLELDGGMYPDKTGEYFIESVSGEFGSSGGRQTVTLGFLMQK
ncbi:hypothetical protein C1637_18565 [Chryseobacterium lactis]|uniref:Phage late control D family protein n=1 Tax=Chryseobacterium lactis TaxID=1241981 RepID=A0A3G6RK08_CHRLC|nr:hypothetical protein [Chryseobacterium lactis]AZA84786.1 hypothetical protein EG342_24075 [Chryseobacterium lactis]AZB05175.1 hypothetical protein EG341_14955 [Chryseobacterium lactis]PNW12157.1 hypothetical protein C1637_18565 [Chryseobacterium lactis]